MSHAVNRDRLVDAERPGDVLDVHQQLHRVAIQRICDGGPQRVVLPDIRTCDDLCNGVLDDVITVRRLDEAKTVLKEPFRVVGVLSRELATSNELLVSITVNASYAVKPTAGDGHVVLDHCGRRRDAPVERAAGDVHVDILKVTTLVANIHGEFIIWIG